MSTETSDPFPHKHTVKVGATEYTYVRYIGIARRADNSTYNQLFLVTQGGQQLVVKKYLLGSRPQEHMDNEVETLEELNSIGYGQTLRAVFPESRVAVFDFAPGESLESFIEEGKGSIAERVGWVRDAALRISEIHGIGRVHRDIKPQNIIVGYRTALIDYELCMKAGNSSITCEGTLEYIAPEQIDCTSADFPADIWALGVTLYQAATGIKPFDGESKLQILLSIQKSTPLAPGIDPNLDKLTLGMIEKAPENRPKLAEVIEELEKVLSSTHLEERTAHSPSTL